MLSAVLLTFIKLPFIIMFFVLSIFLSGCLRQVLLYAQNFVVSTQKNRLNEAVLLSTQNKCYNRWNRKYSQFYLQFLLFKWSYDKYLIHQFKYVFWVVKRTMSIRQLFWAPTTCFFGWEIRNLIFDYTHLSRGLIHTILEKLCNNILSF